MNKTQQMKEMRQQGLTYEKIGAEFGITRQGVHYLIAKGKNGIRQRHSDVNINEIIYEGVYQLFSSDKNMTFSRLASITYERTPNSADVQRIVNLITGKHSTKVSIVHINNLLNYIGKPYEEVFKLRKGAGNV